MKTALITGATSGIGKAIALHLAENNFNIIITGRRANLLKELETEIIEKHKINVLTLNFDIRSWAETAKAYDSLPEEWKNIDVLINNAGLAAGLAPIQAGELDKWERMIDTNIKGLLYITRLVSPGMCERKSGHIVNIGSIAGKEAYLNGNVYCATKFAVDALSKGMRADLLPFGIKVTQICPGMVETEFSVVRFDGDKQRADKVYEGLSPLKAEDIADAVSYAVTRPPHVTINDMVIMPTAQASATQVVRN
jgi:3-hydroxy acid dehydrogenase / malonic semialdehyde reductase